MFRDAILLSLLIGLASCDYLGSIFEASIISAIRSGGTRNASLTTVGHVKNCNPKEADFDITWDPEPILQGKQVTIAGYVSFLTEDFEEGEVEINAAFIKRTYPVKCSDLGVSSCKKNVKIKMSRTLPVPQVPISEISLNAKLKNKKTGHEILCADATIHFK